MKRLKFDPAAVAIEMLDLNRKVLNSLRTLEGIDQIDVGQTARQEIHREDKVRLYYYPAQGDAALQTPLLIVYALVNRPYILDLEPGRSLIKGLTARGIPVYLVDWGYPDTADRFLDLDDYINSYLDHCVDQVLTHAHSSTLNLLGVCQGGTFSICYSALEPEKVRNLITLVTPVDFHTEDNLLGRLVSQVDIDLAIEAHGNVPGFLLAQVYNSLMPMRLTLGKRLDMPHQLENPANALSFLRMERWINDSPDLAGEACREFVSGFYRKNGLMKGGLQIGERAVDPGAFTGPALNLFAARDHLVPPRASQALKAITGSRDYSAHCLPGGHIGMFAGRQAQQQLPDLIETWLRARDAGPEPA